MNSEILNGFSFMTLMYITNIILMAKCPGNMIKKRLLLYVIHAMKITTEIIRRLSESLPRVLITAH
jgi:hypothetical protein